MASDSELQLFRYERDDLQFQRVLAQVFNTIEANANASPGIITPPQAIMRETNEFPPRSKPRYALYRGTNLSGRNMNRKVVLLQNRADGSTLPEDTFVDFDHSTRANVTFRLSYIGGEEIRYFDKYNNTDTGLSDGDIPR